MANLMGNWQHITVGDLIKRGDIEVRTGFAQGDFKQGNYGIPHLRPFNVSDQGFIDVSDVKSIDPATAKEGITLQRGDILFNNTNSESLVGKSAFFTLDGRFAFSNHMSRVRVEKLHAIDAYWLSNIFFHLWTTGVFKELCRRYVNQATVSLAALKTIVLDIPPLPEQRGIARVLMSMQRVRESVRAELDALRQLKSSLIRHLFTYGSVPVSETDQVELQTTESGDS